MILLVGVNKMSELSVVDRRKFRLSETEALASLLPFSPHLLLLSILLPWNPARRSEAALYAPHCQCVRTLPGLPKCVLLHFRPFQVKLAYAYADFCSPQIRMQGLVVNGFIKKIPDPNKGRPPPLILAHSGSATVSSLVECPLA